MTLCRQTRKKKEKKAFLAGVVAEAIQANITREILIQTDSTSSSSIRNASSQRHDAWQLYVRVAFE